MAHPMLLVTGKKSQLKVSKFKLNTLLEITNAINNNLPETDLFDLFQFILRDQLSIGKGLVYYKKGEVWKRALAFGVNEKDISIDVEKDLQNIRGITVMEMMGHQQSKSFDVVIPISHRDNDLAYLLLGDLDEDEVKTSPIVKHLPFIQTIANLTIVAVENKRLNQESVKQEVMKRELEMASEMQGMLLPKQLPVNEYLETAATYLSHQEVGGDFYDVIKISDHEYYLCVADVSGKGISAAILMASFQANLRGNIRQNRELISIANELNERVWSSAKGERFITMFLGIYDADSHVLNYVNCAHQPPMIIGNGRRRDLTNGSVGLGMFEELPFVNIGSVSIKPGDIFVAYTDGVNELENASGEAFSENNMAKIVEDGDFETVDQLNKKFIDAMDAHRGDQPFLDDIALVSCRFL